MCTCFNITGFACLYRSLTQYCGLNPYQARSLVYQLNTANLDTFTHLHPGRLIHETDEETFYRMISQSGCPYKTVVQLYKSMETLLSNISRSVLTYEQHEAVKKLGCLMCDLEWLFHQEHGMDIDDPRTVYCLCSDGLIPEPNEPRVPLLRDLLNIA